MKQHIDRNQWEELTHEQHKEFWGALTIGSRRFPVELPSIGQLIEFLGEEYRNWAMIGDKEKESVLIMRLEPEEELIDALWEAVKFRYNQHIQEIQDWKKQFNETT